MIGLSKISRLALLPALFGRITLAPAVWHEVVVQGRGRSGSAEVQNATYNSGMEVKLSPLSTLDDQRLITETLGTLRFPEYVTGYSVKFDQEPTGDPAVWIDFLVQADDDVAFPKSEISALNKFTNKVRVLLLEKHIQSWPYVRLHLA